MQAARLHPSGTKSALPDPVALFISDLHLQNDLPGTTQAFFDFLRQHALRAQQLYLLGDVFEYWAGDDDLVTPYIAQIVEEIRQVSNAGVAVFWMAGNRDFLVGEKFAQATGVTLLPDPFVATIASQRVVLTHGDAQCTDDGAYVAFRAEVRRPAWQQEFLALPLSQRKTIIAELRDESRTAQHAKSADIMDVNHAAITALFDTTGTELMIHGHTHRPARHECSEHGRVRVRYVLPDWDCDSASPRGGWLAMGPDGTVKRVNFDGTVDGTELP